MKKAAEEGRRRGVRRGAADRERLVRAVLSWLRGCELQRLARRHAAEAEQQSAKHAMLQDQALLLRRSLGDACSLASASQERLWRVRCWALLRRREAEVLMRLGSF
ncbi:unnamed protein product [Prorocentrum cordatum]|uniref:Uncharacterized protein n=1 Tax=Prorocentrum cordatum TaxID=2364126 RepID=A0ABN9TJU5_9DINO|nr:unnamed protein product [Polarella glacialis]